MAEVGSEQQRDKTSLDVAKERYSIEQEINAILRERDVLAKEAEGIDKKALRRLDESVEKIKLFGERQKDLEKRLMEATKAKAKASDPKMKSDQQSQIRAAKGELKRLSISQQIARSVFATAKGEVSILKTGRDEEQFRLEKASDYLGKLGDIFKFQNKNYKLLESTGMVETQNLAAASAFAAVIEYTITKFFEMDKVMAKFRIEFGLLRDDSGKIGMHLRTIYKGATSIAVEFANIGVTIEGVLMATGALANEFGGIMKVSTDLVEVTSIMKAQLGVAEESSAGFLRNISALSGQTAQASKHMLYLASALSGAAGVPLNMVMQDVAKLSGQALTMVSRMPGELVKASVAARVMGTSLGKMADASRHILNFTENVQQEMEASVLLGRSINLQLARELAYRRDIVGSTKEILRIAKNINFENLDTFQMESFANASGRSVDELLKMIQAEKQLNEAKNIDGLRDEVMEYERLSKLRKDELKDVALQREQAVKSMANQARIDALTQQWNKLLLQATAQLFPILDKLLKIAGAVLSAGNLFAVGFDIIRRWIAPLSKIQNAVSEIVLLWTKVKNAVEIGVLFGSKFSGAIAGVFGWFAKGAALLGKFSFMTPFLKAIPVIGWIITGLTFVYSLVKRLMNGEGIGTALKGAIYDTILKPFVDAWAWIKSIFVGNSPSELALGIVRGIVGVEAMLFDALTSPFRRFLAWIADKIPGMGGIAKKLRDGMTGTLQETGVLEKKATTPETRATEVNTERTPAIASTTVTSVPTPEAQKQKDSDSTTLIAILNALTTLNANLLSGKIGINVDSQLLSSTISRNTSFIGGYGVNKVNR